MRFTGNFQDMLEAAAVACCCPGSGGGSGSGGGFILPCCEGAWNPETVSWEITGINCDNADCLAGTDVDDHNPECAAIGDALPAGWQVRLGGGFFSFSKQCGDFLGGIHNSLRIEICCAEKIDDPTQTQLWVSVHITFTHLTVIDPNYWTITYHLVTNSWDLGSCDATFLEIINRPMTVVPGSEAGTPTCTFPDPRVTLVFT